ncbi:TPA: hypothetical protein N0F65_008959 [Lagenidium giganteum]|uniref:Fibronectin type-III domain-containing protein n=1 Tax=Lagenidium giganteum TaxID=4803 RepID=A0AAV2YXW8_9STRA|nr:TPA: hypothetical protein N0F65_008959 [Lagenidium giganteum]
MPRVLCVLWCALLVVGVSGNLFSPQDVPGPPEKILVSSAGDNSLRVQFLPPEQMKSEGNNGAPVLGYKVEIARRVNEVQTFAVSANGPIVAGAYKLTFANAQGTDVTTCIPWNATEVMFEMALDELTNVDEVSVTRSPYDVVNNGYVYTISFTGKYLVSGVQPNLLVADQTGCQAVQPLNRVLSFSGAHVTNGAKGYVPEVWQITSQDTAGTNVLGGNFDLSLGFVPDWKDSLITATVAPGSKVAQTSQSMVGVVNRGDSVKIGGEVFTVHATAPFTDSVLPLSAYHTQGATAAAVLIADTALGDVSVTSGSSSVTTASDFTASITTGEHVKIGQYQFKITAITASSMTIAKVAPTGSDTWPGTTTPHITAYKRKKVRVSVNADAADVKRAMNGLPGIGIVDVTRVGPTALNEYTWSVTMQSLGTQNTCPEAPCLRADKITGSSTLLTDVYGNTCATCGVSAALITNEASTPIPGIIGEYSALSIVATREVGGVVDEVQTIATSALANDIKGTFAVNFKNTFQQTPGVVINFDDTAQDMQTKLQKLPAVGRVNVTRDVNTKFGYTWTVTFLSNIGDLPNFITISSLTGTGTQVTVQEVVKGVSAPYEAIVDGLAPLQDYYLRAFARNANGYGRGTDIIQQLGKGALPLTTHVGSPPDAPSIISMWPFSGSQIGFALTTPVDHGDPIQRYLVEYAVGSSFGTQQIKKLYIYSAVERDITGTFQLQYGDDVTPLLKIQTTADGMVAALRTLPTLRPVAVSRASYVLTGDPTSKVTPFTASTNVLTTTVLSAFQSQVLTAGSTIVVGPNTFVVKVQPSAGDSTIQVQPGSGVANFAQAYSLIKVDPSGAEASPCGYEWSITFQFEVQSITHQTYPGLQLLPSLSSIQSGAVLTTWGFTDKQSPGPPTYYGSMELSNDKFICDSYIIGAPSAVQVIQLFATTTITAGQFQLKLGSSVTPCITIGQRNSPSNMKTALQSLAFVQSVTVTESRAFKVNVLFGSSASKVTAYSSTTGKLTVVSSGANSGLSASDAAVLLQNTVIQVSRNPNNFAIHSCEFTVGAAPAAGDTLVSVTVVGTCPDFANEMRSLKVLDFHDYKVRFWGSYPTGNWPTLKVLTTGTGCPTAWAPTAAAVTNSIYSKVHTIKYTGQCATGNRGVQTILADAATPIGGSFTLSYMGNETLPLAFETTTASVMRDAINAITYNGMVNVSMSQYGVNGKAWRITFANSEDDLIFIKHSLLTGQDALISVYPTMEVYTDAVKNDISGTFKFIFGGQYSEAISYAATHAKVTQELMKLSNIDSVVALGDPAAGDIGVYTLGLTATATGGSPVLTNVQMNGKAIDPTRYLAIREKLTISNNIYSVQSLTPVDVTLTANFPGAAGVAVPVTIAAGQITYQVKPLPGFVRITRLMRVISAVPINGGGTTFQLPADHGYVVGNTFFVLGQQFTVVTVNNAIVTTTETITSVPVTAAAPEVYVFDNKLRTTSDLSQLVAVGDDLWLQSAAGDMIKYTATVVTTKYIQVTGVFTDDVLKQKAHHISFGRKWTLVFRSYYGQLESFDIIPGHDLRGSQVRVGTRRSKAILPQTATIGNPASVQTVALAATTPAPTGASYYFTFGLETTGPLLWTDTGTTIKAALEALDGIDGATVTSVAVGNGAVHTISLWGVYTLVKLPVLSATITSPANPTGMWIVVRDQGGVSESRQDNIILASDQNYQFRVFSINSKGMSNSNVLFPLGASMSSVIPTSPTSVSLGEYRGSTWLSVNYRAPFYSGGAPITMYRLEWDSSPTFDSTSADYGVAHIQKRFEVQEVLTIYRSNAGTSGTFTLSWGGRMTTPLAVDCTAQQMADALAVITDTTNIAVNPVKVTRTTAAWGYSWKITFLNNPGDLATLVPDGTLIAGDFPRIVVNEIIKGVADLAIGEFTHDVQDVFTDAKTAITGSFKLEFEGQITGSIQVSATALEMQQALQAATSLYSIKVTKQWRNQAMNTAIWSVTFAYLKGEEMVGAGNIFNIRVSDASGLGGTAASVTIAKKIVGTDPFQYTISGLRSGAQFYFHVMAYNEDGFGSANSPLSTAITCSHPDPPSSVTASVVDGTTLNATWGASTFNGGCPIDKYKVEWYRAEGKREEQTITTSASKGIPEIQSLSNFADSRSLNGNFKLTFRGETTENILWNAPAMGLNSIKDRLERLSTVGTVDVSRQSSTRVIDGLKITTTGTTTVTVDASSTVSLAQAGLASLTSVWILGQQYTLNVVGATSFTVTVAPPTITVPVPVFKDAFGYVWLITFQGGHVGPQDLIQAASSDNWAGNNPGVFVTTVQKGLQPISGTFRLSFAGGGLSQITPPLVHNVSADDMKKALENLVTVGQVNVTRSVNGYGYNWVVTFITDVANDLTLLGVDDTALHGPSVRISAARTSAGLQPTMYCENNAVQGVPAIVAATSPQQYTIPRLLMGQNYVVRVRAHNAQGYGGAAYITPTYQTPRTIPTVPTNVQLLVLSGKFLKAIWNAPASNGGSQITQYRVQWDTNNAFSNVGSPGFDLSVDMSIQPTDLGPYFFNVAVTTPGNYFVRVQAINDQGPSPIALSTPLSVTPADRTPGKAENVRATVLSSYAILVEWDASSLFQPYYGGDGGLPITQYMIEWDNYKAFDSPAAFGLASGKDRSFIIGGNDPVTGVRSNLLIPGSLYYIRVTGFNAKGAGMPRPSTPASVLVTNQVPTAPRNFNLSIAAADSLRGSWTNPLYDGGSSLKSYQVQWDEQNDFSSGQSASATIPIVREIQSLTVSNTVVNEEQYVDATVEVTNEEQVVRTSFTGIDEIQVIQTTNLQVVDEIQTVTTSATDRDEVQLLTIDADDVNEIQAIRTSVAETLEVQRITVGVTRVNEVQTITLFLPNAVGSQATIAGTFALTFDTTLCTHCTKCTAGVCVKNKGFQTSADLVASLQDTTATSAAATVKTALQNMGNIDTVNVVRTSTTAANGLDLTYVYTITFAGDAVAGDVPLLGLNIQLTVGTGQNIATVGGLPTVATELTKGNEVVFDPASKFTITHTCESYSDPRTAPYYASAACDPTVGTTPICTACVSAYDGTTFTVTQGSTATLNQFDWLFAGVCVFQVQSITGTTIVVVPNDVSAQCGVFSGQQFSLYYAKRLSTPIPVKSAANVISDAGVVSNLLNTIISSVTVSASQLITSTFVGFVYDVTFGRRSGMIPTMACNPAAVIVSNTNAQPAVCTVARTQAGSMIMGTFKIGLAKESDLTTVLYTANIPWDASEATMTSTLQATADPTSDELVFGSVNVVRTVFDPTGNKWSGGFTWKIEFTSRSGNIPRMLVNPTLSNANGATNVPAIVVEDATNPQNPYAGSRDGNQVSGTVQFSFGGITSGAFTVDPNSPTLDRTTLHQQIPDTNLAGFLVAQFPGVIPSIQVTRSAATQAFGYTWSITFSDPANGGDVATLGLIRPSLSGQNAQAQVVESIKGNELGGTFQLKFNGETTGPILFSADPSAVAAQLNSLSTIKPSSVLVSRIGPQITAATQVKAYVWSITFYSSTWADPTSDHSSGIAGNWKGARAAWDDVWAETQYSKAWGRHVGPMQANGFMITCIKDGLTTAASDNSQDCTTAVQRPGVGPIKGTFKISLDSTNAGHMSVKGPFVSDPIAHNAWASKQESGATGTSVEEILERMGNVGDVAVSRSPVNVLTGGYSWTVTFLRDKNGPCEQQEDSTTVVNAAQLCNSPGDVPAMVPVITGTGFGLLGATPGATVCDAAPGGNNCLPQVVQDGSILRGYFSTFKVTGDPGFHVRYQLQMSCAAGATYPCNPISAFTVPVGNELIPNHLKVNDLFYVGTFSTCVFTATSVSSTLVQVTPLTCTAMTNNIPATNPAMGVHILLPWNADQDLVKRVVEASSDQQYETGIWSGGRKVSVVRTVLDKYGQVSWRVRFISNPSYTPPGAGNLPDLTTVFTPNPVVVYQTSVTQVTPGSTGLSGTFQIDFHSTFGLRDVSFDETEDRLQRKLNEMNTIGRVVVKRLLYPSTATGCTSSACSGGWDNQPVDNPGTRGGYRWRVRFMKVTGEYGGYTFPFGSGNVGPLTVSVSNLQGNQKSIDVSTNVPGSSPILGGFILNTSTKATPMLQYSSSAATIKQGIESMNLFGEVDVTLDNLLTQQVPGAVATLSQDGTSATISGVDIRQYFAPGDAVRFGPSGASLLPGTNGDSPITGVAATSTVTVSALSPIVQAQPAVTTLLFPTQRVRIDGLVYSVQRSGQEIQRVAVTVPTGSWSASENRLVFNLKVTRKAGTATTACLRFNVDYTTMQTELTNALKTLDANVVATDVKVTQSGPMATNGGKGYVYSIYFQGSTVAGNVATLVADTSTCTNAPNAAVAVSTVTHGGQVGHQRITLATDAGQVLDTTGFFKLTLGGVTTNCITWGADPTDIQTKLQTTLNSGTVIVSRQGSGNSVTEVQRLRMTSNSQVTTGVTGLFMLAFTITGVTSTTGCLAYGITADDLQTAINNLPNLAPVAPHVNVTRDGDGSSTWGYGYEYLINFRGPLSGGYSKVLGNVRQMEIVNVGQSPCMPVAGGNPALIIETVRQGAPGYAYDVFFLDYPSAITPTLAITDERAGQCNVNWVHSGGSVRKADIEVVATGGSSEVQRLTIKATTAVTGVTPSYKITFNSVTTSTCINFNVDAATLQTKLNALSTIGANGVQVTSDSHPVMSPYGQYYLITFVSDRVSGNVPMLQLVLNDANCVAFPAISSIAVTLENDGGQYPGEFALTSIYSGEKPGPQIAYSVSQPFTVMKEQFEVNTLVISDTGGNVPNAATYQLTLTTPAATANTIVLPWNVDEKSLELALSIAGVVAGDIVVTRRTDATLAPNGYVYTIYFSGATAQGDVTLAQLATNNFAQTTSLTITEVNKGLANAPVFLSNLIPLGLSNDPTTASPFTAGDTSLSVYKVNGFLWTIKFKSTIGNVPALGAQTSALTGKLTVLDDFVPGSASNSYVMTGLVPGILYYAQVAASTDVGIGAYTSVQALAPSGVASPVLNVAAGYALNVREVQEVRVAATHVTEIQSITTAAAQMAEVQTLRTSAAADTCFTSSCLQGKFAYRVPTTQVVKLTAAGPITGGAFFLSYQRFQADPAHAGQKVAVGIISDTTDLAWNAAASDVQAALENLDGIDPGDIIVTRDGDASSTFGYGYVWTVTFIGNQQAGETAPMTATNSANTPLATTGNVAAAVTVTMNSGMAMGTDTEVQQVIISADQPITTGSYTLSLNNLGGTVTSSCISFDAPARGGDVRSMEYILQQMSNVDKVYVTRTIDPVVAKNGFIYRIFFYGNLVRGDVNQLTFAFCTPFQTLVNNALTQTGVNGAVTISTVDEGGFNPVNTFVDATGATAAQLAQDLGRLPIFRPVLTTRSLVDQQGGYIWTAVFNDTLGNLPQLICAVDATFTATTNTKCETFTLTDGNALSGSFVIEASTPLSFDASAADVKSALEAMSWVGTVQVVRSPPTPQMGYVWSITFVDYFGDVPPLMITSSLVGTGSSITVAEVRKGNGISGTFTLSYMSSTTAPIAYNAPATAVDSGGDGSSIQEKLMATAIIGRVSVVRSVRDPEGGFVWTITFLDDQLNAGDLPLLVANSTGLTGVGVVAATREIVKGSNAVGDQLWLSFGPPVADNGNPITQYQVQWDTSATFTSSPAEYYLSDPAKLYQTQQIVSGAPSLAWSAKKATPLPEIQVLNVDPTAAATNTFTLTFRGATTTAFTVGTSTATDLATVLSALSTVGNVIVTPTVALATTVNPGTSFQITFIDDQGNLPPITSSFAKVTLTTTQDGVTNFRKEQLVFSCVDTAGTGSVVFTCGVATTTLSTGTTPALLQAALVTLCNVESDGITVTSTQATICVTTNAQPVTVLFNRVYGDVVTGAVAGTDAASGGTTVTVNAQASINGVYNDVPAVISGTFQVGYQGVYTRSLNAESLDVDVRYALEDLSTIHTVAVTRDYSFQAIAGKVDVVQGQIFVTCSAGETCDFLGAGYGLPGYRIRIGGTWYTVRIDLTSAALDKAKLYLGDVNGRQIGYLGPTTTRVTVYEWTKGYIWTVSMLNVQQPLTYLRAKIPRLYPSDARVTIYGSSCNKCYYLPTQTTRTLTMGTQYFIQVFAYNANGKGQAQAGGPVSATPSRVPDAPSNTDVVVVSGKEIEVFFSPPALAAVNVNPNFNNDINSYIVQWDTRNDFKHGLPVCSNCATTFAVNTLTVVGNFANQLPQGAQFTISDQNCVLTVQTSALNSIIVNAGHNCPTFSARAYPLYYYTYPPAIISGLPIQGSPPFRYLISNLVVNTQYYVRVAAVNSVPVQQIALSGTPPDNRKWSFPLTVTTKDMVPDPPISVMLNTFAATTLELQVQPPTRDGQGLGGAAITDYWIDIDTVATFDSPTKPTPVLANVAQGAIPLLYPGGPRVYYIKNLLSGTRYYVQVKAKNAIGLSRATIATNPLSPVRSPDPPVGVRVSTVASSPTPITTATVTWQNPVFNGGMALTSFKIEWWGIEARPEVQVIEIKWTTTPTTANFLLYYGGLQTSYMPFNVAPENVRSALMNIITAGNVQLIRDVQVSRQTINVNKGYQWRVTFNNAVNVGNLPLLQFAFDQGTMVPANGATGRVFEGTSGIAVPQTNYPGKREVQVLVTSHPTTTVGGYFRLSFKGSRWSNYLSATIAAADLKAALESLPTVGKVTVTDVGQFQNGKVWTIAFESNVGNMPVLIVDGTKLTPSDAFIGVKDGDNLVTSTGVLCMPGEDICTGTWIGYKTNIASMAVLGEAAVEYNFYETIDANTMTYQITGLTPGKTYYVAVTAKNAMGLGLRVLANPSSIIPPVQVPQSPTNVAVGVKTGISTQLTVSFNAPTSDGGVGIRMYRVEYDPSPLFSNRGTQDFWCPSSPVYAVWTLQTARTGNTGGPIGSGFFTIQITRNNLPLVSEPIPWNAAAMSADEVGGTPSQSKVFCSPCPTCVDQCQSNPQSPFGRRELSGSMQSKLQYIPSITTVQVQRSSMASDGGYTWTITFMDVGDDYAITVQSPNALTCSGTNCVAGTYTVTPTKLTAGINYPPCVATQTIPSTGALNKGQLYYMRVFAYNKIGFSLPGLAASPQKPMVVPGPPTGVTLQVLTVSDLKVLFSPPDDNGGDTIVEYQVQWALDIGFTNPQSASVVLLGGGAPYYRVISNLVKGTFYFVRVRARNSQGYGQFQVSSPASLNPYTTPSAPTQVVLGITSSTMLTVGWNVPDDNGGDAITAYTVQWDISASFDSLGVDATKVKITDVTQRSYTITLLTPGTLYYVRVFAVNSGGQGTPQTSTPGSAIPVNTRPGKPHSLQVTGTTNNGELQINWQQPRIPAHGVPCAGTLLIPQSCPIFVNLDVVFGGTSLESYMVQWADNTDFTGFNTMSVTTNSALVTGLVSGKTYYVRVLAVNAQGLKSDFCERGNQDGYLCPMNLQLPSGMIKLGPYVSATPQ